jgi:hypothetical protein
MQGGTSNGPYQDLLDYKKTIELLPGPSLNLGRRPLITVSVSPSLSLATNTRSEDAPLFSPYVHQVVSEIRPRAAQTQQDLPRHVLDARDGFRGLRRRHIGTGFPTLNIK